MKRRFGFVSNSSSSSFIVAVKDIKNTGDYPDFIFKLFNKMMDSFIEEKITTIEELNKYFIDLYGYGDINTIEKLLDYYKDD